MKPREIETVKDLIQSFKMGRGGTEMNHKTWLYVLIVSSVLMFASIFSMSYKLLGIGLLQWVVVLFLAFNTTILKRFSFSDFSEYNDKVMRESWKEKKLMRTATYAMAAPMVLVGLSFVMLSIAVLIIFG